MYLTKLKKNFKSRYYEFAGTGGKGKHPGISAIREMGIPVIGLMTSIKKFPCSNQEAVYKVLISEKYAASILCVL